MKGKVILQAHINLIRPDTNINQKKESKVQFNLYFKILPWGDRI